MKTYSQPFQQCYQTMLLKRIRNLLFQLIKIFYIDLDLFQSLRFIHLLRCSSIQKYTTLTNILDKAFHCIIRVLLGNVTFLLCHTAYHFTAVVLNAFLLQTITHIVIWHIKCLHLFIMNIREYDNVSFPSFLRILYRYAYDD